MCRLYGFLANEPTRVECSLIKAQNALLKQSGGDSEGLTHGHGWGVADYSDGVPFIEKQAWAAYHGEHFMKNAARIYAHAGIAHVRRATVGPAAIENTHPFAHGVWMFAHNGTVPNFDLIRVQMLENMDPLHRTEIKGVTDSEHVFRYLMTLWERDPARPLTETLRIGVEDVVKWCHATNPTRAVGLNILWTDGKRMVGSKINRTLWYIERRGVVPCDICGQTHVHHSIGEEYMSVEVASEPITHERWREVSNGTVFTVDPDYRLNIHPLSSPVMDALKGVEAFDAPASSEAAR